MSLTATNQLRQLQDDANSNSSLFLGLNIGIVIVMILSIFVYCTIFRNRFDALIRNQSNLNDEVFEQNIRNRQLQRQLAATQQVGINATTAMTNTEGIHIMDDEESPESRRNRLMESFLRNKVTAVSDLLFPYGFGIKGCMRF
jgi:hypothetical protein